MSALIVALGLAWVVHELTKDRHVYHCTLCSNGVIWTGTCWLHVGGQLEAPTEPLMTTTHPAIPAT